MSADLALDAFTLNELLVIEIALQKQIDSDGVVDQETVDMWVRVTEAIEGRTRLRLVRED